MWYERKYGGLVEAAADATDTRDTQEKYDGLEASHFSGDVDAYTFYKAKKSATMKPTIGKKK